MAPKSNSPEISEGELRRMLLERRRADRERRMRAYREQNAVLPLDAEVAESSHPDKLAGHRVHPRKGLRLNLPRSRSGPASRLLLVVEVLAVLGLVLVFINGLNVLADLNDEVSALFAGDFTPSPTPLLQPAVLPAGHTPPGEEGGAQPNEAEIPAHLRPQMQAYTASLVLPTPGPQQARRIEIQNISVNAPIVQGDDWESLKRGVGQHVGSADPGTFGNLVLSGHNDIYGQVFRHLDDLNPGDEIIIHTDQRSFTYLVSETMLVSPTAIEVLFPTEDPTLTLISCYPYLIDSQRIVVRGVLQN